MTDEGAKILAAAIERLAAAIENETVHRENPRVQVMRQNYDDLINPPKDRFGNPIQQMLQEVQLPKAGR